MMTEKQLLRERRNEKITALYQAGKTLAEISAQFGLKRQMVKKILIGRGIFRRRVSQKIKLTAAEKLRKKELEFWSRAALTADVDRCWEWLGKVSQAGYPRAGWSGRVVYARRIAWLIWNGEEPADNILNRCGNPICINPNHLIEAFKSAKKISAGT